MPARLPVPEINGRRRTRRLLFGALVADRARARLVCRGAGAGHASTGASRCSRPSPRCAIVRLEAARRGRRARERRADRTVHRRDGQSSIASSESATRRSARRSASWSAPRTARRLWRVALTGDGRLVGGGARESLYRDEPRRRRALAFSEAGCEALSVQLQAAELDAMAQGRVGMSEVRPAPAARPDPRRRADRAGRRRGGARRDRQAARPGRDRPAGSACGARAQRRRVRAERAAVRRRSSRAASSPAIRSLRTSTSRSKSCSCRAARRSRPDEEIELGAEDCDVVFHDGGDDRPRRRGRRHAGAGIDPYPRARVPRTALKAAGV